MVATFELLCVKNFATICDMATQLNIAKSAWDNCLHKNCKQCNDAYGGKKFVVVRRAVIKDGDERNAKVGQDLYLPKLEELKKINSQYDVPMESYKKVRKTSNL